ncbi:EamA family transporter, partial [Kineococcus glutinatus]|uniref:EamA family transporter n=1 Tax=Kineococcus glutinatus TaxID=1070872 RepID=UPI0031E7487D
MISRALLPDLGVLSVALVWGCSFVAVQQAATGASVALVLAVRFGLAALLLLPVVLLATRGRAPRGSWPAALRRGVVPGALLLAVFLLETHGAVRTTPARAGVLIALFAVVVPFAAAVRERRAPRW